MSYATPSSMMALAVSFFNIASILVLLRLVGRWMQKTRKIWVDDVMLTISWIFMLAISILMITAVSFGLWGKSLPPRRNSKGKIDPYFGTNDLLIQSEEFFFFTEVLLPLQLMFAKLSILFFYRRVFCTTSVRDFLHWATLVTIVLVSLWGVTMSFVYIFQCGSRVSLAWEGPLILEAKYCLPANIEVAMGTTDAGIDLIILALPIPRLLKLQIPKRKKLLVLGAFAVGGLTLAGSLLRLSIYTSELLGAQNSFTDLDENMLVSTAMYWSMFEAGFAVTTACLPSLQYLLIRAATSLTERFGSYYGGRSSPQASGKSGKTWGSNGIESARRRDPDELDMELTANGE